MSTGFDEKNTANREKLLSLAGGGDNKKGEDFVRDLVQRHLAFGGTRRFRRDARYRVSTVKKREGQEGRRSVRLVTIRVAVSASVCSDVKSLLSDQSSCRDTDDNFAEAGPALQQEAVATDCSVLLGNAVFLGVVFYSDYSCSTRVTVLGATVHTSLVQSTE